MKFKFSRRPRLCLSYRVTLSSICCCCRPEVGNGVNSVHVENTISLGSSGATDTAHAVLSDAGAAAAGPTDGRSFRIPPRYDGSVEHFGCCRQDVLRGQLFHVHGTPGR